MSEKKLKTISEQIVDYLTHGKMPCVVVHRKNKKEAETYYCFYDTMVQVEDEVMQVSFHRWSDEYQGWTTGVLDANAFCEIKEHSFSTSIEGFWKPTNLTQ